jgi:crotonobetainyl-CoA:carnitine CoA-transferase CaiB-like acyl-CoA transferase
MGAYWGRAGVAAALTVAGQDLPYQRGGFGDHMTGLALAGGIAAALFARQSAGEGRLVSTSLLRAGMYQIGADLNTSLRTGLPTVAASIRSVPNPLLTGYRCADGEWIWLLCLEGDRHWPYVAAALELDELLDDPRFATMEGRRDHTTDVSATLQRRFDRYSRDEWSTRLDAHGVWWAKVQHVHELIDDEQAHAAGGFVDVALSDGTSATMVATPVDFSGRSRYGTLATPELGQDTEAVLLELGWDWDRIASLKEAGVI